MLESPSADVQCLFPPAAVIYQWLGVKQLFLPAYLSHASLPISRDHFADQTVTKYSKSHTQQTQGTRSYLQFRQHGETTNLMHSELKSAWFIKLGPPFFSNFSSWLLLLGDKCAGICSLLPQRAKDEDFKGRGLRLGPISPDITDEVSCLGTWNVSLPSGVLIITHTKPPHQSNWILERKLKVSRTINSAAVLFVCLLEY